MNYNEPQNITEIVFCLFARRQNVRKYIKALGTSVSDDEC